MQLLGDRSEMWCEEVHMVRCAVMRCGAVR